MGYEKSSQNARRTNKTRIAYVAVTDDIYQFPVAISKTMKELGEAVGYDQSHIGKVIAGIRCCEQKNKRRLPITFVKMEVEQGFWDEYMAIDDGGNPSILFENVQRLFDEFCLVRSE